MDEALALAARGLGRTCPNPAVGALIVSPGGEVIGRGWHERAGAPHAEIHALREAGAAARGATLYVTLEPCAHHGRTPPCATAIVEAGLARVVVTHADPNPQVAGKGIAQLRAAGIQVDLGVCAREAARLNEPFLFWQENGRPLVTLKAAMSLDGKIALRSGESRWISGEESRAWAHEIRDRVDAILVGAETVVQDDPLLTARPEGREGKPLIRIVLDSTLRIGDGARILSPDRGVATILAATSRAPEEKVRRFEELGAEVLRFPPDREGRVPLRALLEELGKREVLHLLVEGGGRVHGSFLDEGIADNILFFIAPMIIGDTEAPGPVQGCAPTSLAGLPRVRNVEIERFGEDILVRGDLHPPVWEKYGESPHV